MRILQEFREFAIKGNMVDLAVGVIIGGAFHKIVDSLVGDIVMPVLSRMLGRLDFSNRFVVLADVPPGTAMTIDALRKAGVPVLAWGNFVTVAVNFLVLAIVIFLMVRGINRMRRGAEAPPQAEDVLLLREIRDSLKRP